MTLARTIFLPLLLLAGWHAASGAPATPHARAGAPSDFLLRENAGFRRFTGVTIDGIAYRRVESDDPGRTAEPGRPALPERIRWIGVPEGYAIQATVESLETKEFPGAPAAPAPRDTLLPPDGTALSLPARDEAFYRTGGWYPERIALTGPVRRLRHQRVAPVILRPIQADPAGGTIRVHERMVVRIRFVPDPEEAGKAWTATEPAREEAAWEPLYRSTVANYEEARAFRTRPARAPSGGGKRAAAGSDEWRLRVAESGLYRIEWGELAAEGFPAGSPLEDVRLVRRGWSEKAFDNGEDPFTETVLPLRFRDRDGDGFFGDGDAFLAWLPGFREDRMTRDFEDRYDTEAAYFLLPEGGGASFATRPGRLGYAGLDPLPSFPDSIRWEVDAIYEMNVISDTTDLYFPWGRLNSNKEIAFELPAPDTAEDWGWRAMTISNSGSGGRHNHRYLVLDSAAVDTLLNVLITWEKPDLHRTEKTLPGRLLREGTNPFLYRGYRGYDANTDVSGVNGFLDWLEIRASFLYRASGDYLLFSSGGEKGRVRMAPEGFADSSLTLLDLSDPYAPVRIVVDSLRREGETWTAVIEDSVEAPVRYAAATDGGARRLGEGKIVRDAAGGLDRREASVLIVSHDRFAPSMEPLATHRSGRGLPAAVIRLQDVYDEFNGGVKDPEAIRNYFRYAFSRWSTPPTHVLLVGDGYEDYKGAATNYANSDDYADEVDYVPARPIYNRYPLQSSDRWSVSDLWYALLDGDGDDLPDILLGRFPVKTGAEAEALVAKTIRYETEDLNAPWRRRFALVADDAWWIASSGWSGSYYDADQTQFEDESLRFAERITDSAAVRADTALLLARPYTSVYQGLCPDPNHPDDPDYAEIDCVIAHSRGDTAETGGGGEPLREAFFDLVNERGAFGVNWQGHASRSALSHELFLVEGRDYRNKDHYDLTELSSPDGPPYIFTAFACAASEFEVFRSLGDEAITEAMVRLPEGGAILSFGSTRTEHLTPNLVLNRCLMDRLYPRPAKGTRAAGTRTAGEVFAGALADFAGFGAYDRDDILPWVLFGDPALAIGPFPPELAVVANGDTLADGDVALGGPGGEPLRLRAVFTGDVRVEEEEILLFEDGAAVPDSDFAVEAGVDSASNRWTWTLAYDRALNRPPEEIAEIRVRVTDRFGNRLDHAVRTTLEPEFLFDGRLWDGAEEIPTATELIVRVDEAVDLDPADLSVEAAGTAFAPDTLYREEKSWAARFDLVLPEGETELVLSVRGWAKAYPVTVVKSAYAIAATVDGRPVETGHLLLGRVDGEAPEIRFVVRLPRDLPEPEVRILDGDAEVDSAAYTIAADSVEGNPALAVLWRPAIRNETYAIRFEADGEGAPLSAFLLNAGVPLSLTLDGADVVNGDFVAAEPRAEAVIEYPDSLPEEEVLFELNGEPEEPDSIREEGAGLWKAYAGLAPGGGAHTLLVRAGAYSASASFRVENDLRIADPLCHPNPAPDRRGFYYQLSRDADRVRIEIFTVAGRRIRVLENLSAERGYNANPDAWDGRDADGDRIARGAYPFRITAFRGSERAEATGVLVVGDEES